MSLNHVIFELNAKAIVDEFYSLKPHDFEFGVVIHSGLSISEPTINSLFALPEDKLRIAHALARESYNLPCSFCTETPPSILWEFCPLILLNEKFSFKKKTLFFKIVFQTHSYISLF